MPNALEPRYRFEAATGQLFFEIGRSRTIVGDIDLAVAWTTDEDLGGCLHKHGRTELVEAKAAAIRAIDPSVQVAVIPWEAIRHPDAGPKILEEVNACLAISGRVSGLTERLGDIAAEHEIELFPRDRAPAETGMTP
ncbi:hypothetical protein OCH239_10845 [Roseivivax halodurans JCM 10272]|uniref:Uncharacterized protein n=1 Tax=Roseivivax halodurans JCM 10272 TaxID=1449350 RepID=X7EBL0_9RHOB|nr:hypothetical protein [Roseivivax halodurans]ETX13332.1 hypothetical protein OCH239_10845 [Roseivivax halodurans JCM 10272]